MYYLRKIIDFSIKNKFAVWILTVLIAAMGTYTGMTMKQELMPDITLPNITIVTTYPGASPDEVTDDVTIPIEQQVEYLEGIKFVSSSSAANYSSVFLEFDYSKDMDVAKSDIKEVLEDLELPDGASKPQVSKLDINAFPVLALSMSNTDISMDELTKIVENEIFPDIQSLSGVADVQVTGQQIKKANVIFDDKKLEEYGLTEDDVEQILSASEANVPVGLTNFDGEIKNVIVDGDIVTLEDLENLKIPYTPEEEPGAGEAMPELPEGMDPSEVTPEMMEEAMKIPTVKFSELASFEVVDELESINRTNGEDSVGMQIVKAPEANTVEVVNKVLDLVPDFEKEFGLTVVNGFDQGEPIEESVNTMLEKALFGILFAIVIIMLFLRSVKTTVISIVSIPMSLLIALIALNYLDISLNILTLGALTVAIGRVIDDSIVVMENIYRRLQLETEELRGIALVREATMEMFVPIASSTIVTMAVFLPIGLVDGQAGELFLPFAIAISVALAASLLIAVTIVPMLAHTFFKKQLYADKGSSSIKKKQEHGKLATLYRPILEWTLNHKVITFGSAVVLLIGSLFLVSSIGASFLPEDEENMILATYSPEPSQTLEDVEAIALEAEEKLLNREGIASFEYSLGGGSPMSGMGMGSDNAALFFIEYEDDFKGFADDSDKLMDELNDETGIGTWGSMDFMSMGGGLELIVYANSKEDIEAAVDQILEEIEGHPDLEDVKSSIAETYDEYVLAADQDKLSELGLTAAQVGMALMNHHEEKVLTTIKVDKKDVDVYVEVKDKAFKDIDDMTDIELATPLGTEVKLGDVVEVKEGETPGTVTRLDGKLNATISADILSKDQNGVSRDVEKKIDKLDFELGVSTEFGGVTEQIDETFTQLGLAMLAAIAIVYFILVVTFGGGLAPLAILFSLPFTIIGSLVALWIAGEPLSVSALIGGLMLIGIVVTNAIVLIDRVIRNEADGLNTREAIVEAGMTRLRPILMTALATIFALVPLAISSDSSGALISQGVGITVIGGLISSTVLTLVIVPIVYEVLSRFMKPRLKE